MSNVHTWRIRANKSSHTHWRRTNILWCSLNLMTSEGILRNGNEGIRLAPSLLLYCSQIPILRLFAIYSAFVLCMCTRLKVLTTNVQSFMRLLQQCRYIHIFKILFHIDKAKWISIFSIFVVSFSAAVFKVWFLFLHFWLVWILLW